MTHLTLENKYIDKSSYLNYEYHQQFKNGALCNYYLATNKFL